MTFVEEQLRALVIAAVELAIHRYDLTVIDGEEMDVTARREIAEDTADAVMALGTCAEDPIEEWTACLADAGAGEGVR